MKLWKLLLLNGIILWLLITAPLAFIYFRRGIVRIEPYGDNGMLFITTFTLTDYGEFITLSASHNWADGWRFHKTVGWPKP